MTTVIPFDKRVADFKRKFNVGKAHRVPPPSVATSRRSFTGGWEGATPNRLTADWILSTRTQDAEIYEDIYQLRNRCRSIGRTDWGSRYKRAMINNVLKDQIGFSLQMQVMRPPDYIVHDLTANDIIERAWSEFCKKKNCTVTSEDSMFDVCSMALTGRLEAGGLMVRKIIDPNANDFGFVLQLIEVDHLDYNYNARLGNDNRIVMGVEKNKLNKTVAYHILDRHPGDALFGQTPGHRTRVPANEIIHYFLRERPNQSIGVPDMAPPLARIRQLVQYELAEVVAARSAAEKGGYFYSERGEQWNGEDEVTLDENGNQVVSGKYNESEIGQNDFLPPGMKFQSYDPTHPTSQYGQFTKDQLLGIAAGWNISYASLTGDLSNANYSSMRSGSIEEREGYKKFQAHMIVHLMQEIFDAWLATSITNGAINLPMSKFKQFNKPRFTGRRWPWVDPQKDITAALMEIEGGLGCRGDVLAEGEHDRDVEELAEVLKLEKQAFENAGIMLPAMTSSSTQPQSETETETETPDKAEK